MAFHDISQLAPKNLAEGIRIRFVPGEQMMMVFYDLDAGAVIPEHSHPHEQIGLVLQGSLEIVIDGERKLVHAGEAAYHVPGGVVHSALCGDQPVKVVEVFSPPREDFLAL